MDRMFTDTAAQALRQHQDFHIEGEPIQPRTLENILGSGAPEDFAAALRIPEPHPKSRADNGVEHSAQQRPCRRRFRSDAGLGQRA